MSADSATTMLISADLWADKLLRDMRRSSKLMAICEEADRQTRAAFIDRYKRAEIWR